MARDGRWSGYPSFYRNDEKGVSGLGVKDGYHGNRVGVSLVPDSSVLSA